MTRHKFFLTCLFAGLFPFAALCQNGDPRSAVGSVDTAGFTNISGKPAPLQLQLDGEGFFYDNEHAGSTRVNGYTLPGFYLRPHLNWRIDEYLQLQLGVHWLHFWGNHSPHDANEVGLINTALDSIQPPMVVPWMQLRITPARDLTIILGSIPSEGHRLPLPLYNNERIFADRPENGFQILFRKPWLDLDLWVDWQRFAWNRSPHREVFIAGLSSEGTLLVHQTGLHLPLHIVIQHLGGENRTDTLRKVETHCNLATGIGVSRQIGQWDLRADYLAMLYGRTGAPEGDLLYIPNWEDWWYLTSPRRNFKHGLGIYPRLTVQWRNLWMEGSYWVGDKFVPILGCYHYSNVSVNTSDMTHDRIRVAALRASWTFKPSDKYHLKIYGAWFHYYPYSADRTNNEKVQGSAAEMLSFGLQLHFNPAIDLRF